MADVVCVCYLVGKPSLIGLGSDFSAVLFPYRWSVQSVVYGGSIGFRGVFIVFV